MRHMMELVKMGSLAATVGLIVVRVAQPLTAAAIAVALLYLLTARVT